MDISKIGARTIKAQEISGKSIGIIMVIRIGFGMCSAGMLAYFASPALMPTDTSLAEQKPVNEPTFITHVEEAKDICNGPVVKTGPKKVASDVVVVRNNGHVVLMDTGEAVKRWESKSEADNVWAVAICRSHLER